MANGESRFVKVGVRLCEDLCLSFSFSLSVCLSLSLSLSSCRFGQSLTEIDKESANVRGGVYQNEGFLGRTNVLLFLVRMVVFQG